MHRLFVAIRPPAPVRRFLLAAMEGVSGARWQVDEQLHCTLKFIGEVDRHCAEDVAAALGRIHFNAFAARVAGTGSFDKRGMVHTLWAGLEPAAELTRLHHKVEQACRTVGIAPETRAFVPHITLARLNRSSGPIHDFRTRHGGLSGPEFIVDSVILYESRMGRGGSRYDATARYPLDSGHAPQEAARAAGRSA